MQNEELTKELNLLQEKFKKEIEDVKKKYEKVEKINGWYKDDKFPNWIAYYDFDNNTMYGIDSSNEWFNMSIYAFKNNRLATPEEVEAALTKEAVKRGFKEGVKLCGKIGSEDLSYEFEKWKYYELDNRLELYGSNVFDNGTWAEIIKEKTLDELASEYYNFRQNWGDATCEAFKAFLKENKQEVINILNNL
jgi:hypothetical protein